MRKIVSFQEIRGIAILLIVFHHYLNLDNSMLGCIGVSVFFMMTGYLSIYTDSYDGKEYHFKEHMKRLLHKIKKFYPLHMLTLILSLPLSMHIIHDEYPILKFASNVFLVQAWIPDEKFYYGFNGVSWFLSALYFFYMVEPFLVKLIKNLTFLQLKICICCIITFFIIYCFLIRKLEYAYYMSYIFPMARCLDCLIGMCICEYGKYKCSMKMMNNKYITLALLSIVIFDMCLVKAAALSKCVGGEYIFNSACWIIPHSVLLFICGKEKLAFESKILIFIGDISMELFLIHKIVYRYLLCFFEMLGVQVNNMVTLLFAVFGSMISAYFLKKYLKI